MESKPKQRWIPLESNPAVLNKYLHNLGMEMDWNFVDIYGLDPDLLAIVPRPVVAVVLLFPCKDPYTDNPIGEIKTDYPEQLYFTKQTIGNACGTVAVVHALANNSGNITFDEVKHFKTFYENTKSLSPAEKAKYLEEDLKMGSAHEDCAQEGDTTAPAASEHVKHHFVAFVQHDGTLYELDGAKDGPISHGETSADSFLEDTSKVVKSFMDRASGDLSFSLMALAKCPSD